MFARLWRLLYINLVSFLVRNDPWYWQALGIWWCCCVQQIWCLKFVNTEAETSMFLMIWSEVHYDNTCKAEGLSAMTSAASLKALLAFCSPSAAITFALASLAASASAAIALWRWTGRRTSFLERFSSNLLLIINLWRVNSHLNSFCLQH